MAAMLNELAVTANGFLEETSRVAADAWSRTATRSQASGAPLWLVRHAAHEGTTSTTSRHSDSK